MKNQPFARKLRNAWRGIAAAWSAERNLRVQAVVALAVFAGFGVLRPAPVWWALIVLCIVLVLAAEMLNSALEALLDHLHPDLHPRVGRVKDMLAGMVLIVSVGAAVIGGIALYATLCS